jgi:hypothetical protein
MLHQINSLPTHLFIGVRKSATSWVWKQVDENPMISVPKLKEVYFFSHNFDKGIEWYKNEFNPNKIVLDMTPDYFIPGCAKRVKSVLPNSKIMVCLRNPLDRAFSQWKFARFNGLIKTNIGFFNAWISNLNNIKTYGIYDKSLKEYIDCFGDNFNVVFYDDLKKDAWEFICQFYNFLGIEPYKSNFFNQKWMPLVNNDPIKMEKYNKINKNVRILPQERKNIIKFYSKSVKEISKILNKDLSHWLIERE